MYRNTLTTITAVLTLTINLVLSQVVINEIHYNPASSQGSDNDYEFMELYNPGTTDIDMSGYYFTQGVTHTFADGTTFPAGGYILITTPTVNGDIVDYNVYDPDGDGYHENGAIIIEHTSGGLSNGGEDIELVDAAGNLIDYVDYEDGVNDYGDWEATLGNHDGGGSSLELIDPNLDNRFADNWQGSWVQFGTPGAPNSSESVNNSLHFDGMDDYVDVNVNTENDFSISGWFKFETADNGNAIIASNSNDFIRIDTYENQKYFGYNSPTGANHRGATALSENTWYHFAVTRSGSDLSFYLNGDFDGSFNEPSTVLDWVKIGVHRNGSQHHFHGNIDEVSIWNVAQTQEQIQANMSFEISGTEEGLVGYWNFNEGEGTILTDLSGNGNHGMIYGATWSDDGAPVQPLEELDRIATITLSSV